MPVGRFRDITARMDAVLVARLGDRAVRADGVEVFGAFLSPFSGAELGAGQFKIGAGINTDEVIEPTFTLRHVDAVGLVAKAFIVVDVPLADGGGRYQVIKTEPDGTGMVTLKLKLVSS
jgi:hypothetical protein